MAEKVDTGKEEITVAYSGIEGSFASIATGKLFPDAGRVSCRNFAEAYRKVEEGKCEIAVLPIENSYAGEVGQVMDLMFEGDLSINGVYELGVSHCLLGPKGSSLETVRKVISHPQALEQCDEYIYEHGFETIQSENTARAARCVAERADVSVAAIASQETAELYGLKVLEKQIHQSSRNTTRFAVFSKSREALDHPERYQTFILMFTVKHEAGTLAKAISVLGKYGYSMRVIRSRPLKNENWQYYFYTEVDGDISSLNGMQMLVELGRQCVTVKVIGAYTPGLTI